MAIRRPENAQPPLPRVQDVDDDNFAYWVLEAQGLMTKLLETYQARIRKLEQELYVVRDSELRHRCKLSDAHPSALPSLPEQLQQSNKSPRFSEDKEVEDSNIWGCKFSARQSEGARIESPDSEERRLSFGILESESSDCAASDRQSEGARMGATSSIKSLRFDALDTDSSTSGNAKEGDCAEPRTRQSTMAASHTEATNLWSKFEMLDSDGGGSVTAEDLLEWRETSDPYFTRGPRDEEELDDTIENFNIVMGIETGDRPMEITFASFCTLMGSKFLLEGPNKLDPKLYANMKDIRELLQEKTRGKRASLVIASAMDLAREDLKKKMEEAEANTMDLTKYLEVSSACVIILNALTLGAQADMGENWSGWLWLECFYTCFYVGEIVAKLKIGGWRAYFAGPDLMWNYLDVLIVMVAVMELLSTMLGGMLNVDLSNLTIIRLCRLVRLSRLIRLIRVRALKELQLMINGILGGFRALTWAIILFSLVVYSTSLLLRFSIGTWVPTEACEETRQCSRSEAHFAKYHGELFSSMPRTMLTVYRCLTQGCESVDGTPLIAHLYSWFGDFGWFVLCFYVIVTVFIMFGVFNVITAIFVEQTYETSRQNMRQAVTNQKTSVSAVLVLQRVVLKICDEENNRASDLQVRSPSLASVVRKSLNIQGQRTSVESSEVESTSEKFANLGQKKIIRERFLHVIRHDSEVRDALQSLDVYVGDAHHLFDLLDADGSGKLDPEDMVTGLMKLRGLKEEGYQVASLLGVRALQRHVRDIHNLLKQNTKTVRSLHSSKAAKQLNANDETESCKSELCESCS